MIRYGRTFASMLAIAIVAAASGLLGPLGASGATGASNAGIATFAEQPGAPPNYIFPFVNGEYGTNNNQAQLQPLMWLPLYWIGHPSSSTVSVDYKLSLADKPVFSNQDKTVTVTLKHYRWSTGSPVTSRDLVFWMNLLVNEKTQYDGYAPGGWTDHVTSYTDPSPDTFVLNLSRPYNPTYLMYNGLATLVPLPQQAWDKTSKSSSVGNYDETSSGAKLVYKYLNSRSLALSTWDTTPLWQVVDGPWHLQPKTGFQVTGQTILVPNLKYSGPNKPKLSELEELPFTSSASEYDALRAGTVDYGYVPYTDASAIPALKGQGFSIKPWYLWGFSDITINYSQPKYGAIVKQLYIRQAMDMLVDQSKYIKVFFHGFGAPTYGPTPILPKSDFLNPAETESPYPYDPSKAKNLLVQHGWSVPAGGGAAVCERSGSGAHDCGAGIASGTHLKLTFLYSSGFPYLYDAVQVMRSTFFDAGIDLLLSSAPYNTTVGDGFSCIGKTAATCSPSSPALTLYSSPVFTLEPDAYPDSDNTFGCGAATNGGNYCNPQIQKMIQSIASDTTAESRKVLFQYEVALAKQVPGVWFPSGVWQISAVSSKLSGVGSQDPTTKIYPSTWTLKT
jgi:peptide/nickel transport system substrate-binding protein